MKKGLSDMNKELEKHIQEIEKLGIKKDVFKTPENYFENFEDSLFVKVSEEQLPSEAGFKVANGYFESFDEKIISKVQKKKQGKLVRLKLFRAIGTIAAMFVLYFGISRYNTADQITFDSISENDLNTWIITSDIELNESELASIIAETNNSKDLTMEDFTEKELIEYLDQVNPDLLFLEQ